MSENITNKRLDYIDMAKGFGILFVVLGHIEYTPEPLRIWISTFHMPLFFIISGILMAIKDEPAKDFKEVYVKRAKGIMIPYFWFSLAYAVIDLGNIYIGNIDWNIYKYNQVSSLILYGSGPLWFLPALFLAEIIFVLMKQRLGDKASVVLLIALPFVCWAAEQSLNSLYVTVTTNLLYMTLINLVRVVIRAVISASFVGIAYYLHKVFCSKIENYDDVNDAKRRVINLFVGAVLVVVLAFTCGYNNCADLHNLVLGNPILYFIFAYVGSYGVILLCKALWPVRFIKYYGRNSLIIMALHLNFYIVYAGIKMASLADVPIVKMFDTYTHPEWNEAYVLVVIVVATFIISIIPIELINRIFPFIMGRRKNK